MLDCAGLGVTKSTQALKAWFRPHRLKQRRLKALCRIYRVFRNWLCNGRLRYGLLQLKRLLRLLHLLQLLRLLHLLQLLQLLQLLHLLHPLEFPQREPQRWKPLGRQVPQDQMLETDLSTGHKKMSVTALELAVQLVV